MIRTAHHPTTTGRATLAAIALSALLACSEQPTAPPPAGSLTPSAASADRGERGTTSRAPSTLAWQKRARDLVAVRRLTPIAAIRMYALHSVAQYAAVEAVSEHGDGDDRGGSRARNDAQRGAIAGASARVLAAFPGGDPTGSLEAQVVADGRDATGQTSSDFTRGVAAGRAAATAVLARADHDGYSLVWTESMRNAPGPGIWEGALAAAPGAIRPFPAGYQFPMMKPYFLEARGGRTAQSQFRSPEPPAFANPASRFWIDLAEVKDIAAHRTVEQTRIANYWNLNVGTVTALGYWDEQGALFIDEHRLDERAASHLYALMNAAAMDATIGCWETKYHYLMLRPSMADPTITLAQGIIGPPAFPFTLPNHPSYPSGHSCVSAAAVTILSRYFPSHSGTLGAALIEAGESRIYGGIHYRFDIDAGQTLGRATAEWAMAYDRRHGLLAAVGLGGRHEDEHD